MKLTIVKPKDCKTCDTSTVEQALNKLFPKTQITYLDYESSEGKALVQQVKANALPLYVYDTAVSQGANFAQASQAFVKEGEYYVIPSAVVGASYVLNPPTADDDAFKGNANAPVTIIEFSDFQCPFCKRFYEDTLPQLLKEYVDTGKAKFVYRDYPLDFHPQAQKAAEAAECAGDQGKFWEMHDKLFENQQSLSVENHKKWATELDLDTTKFNDCLDTGKNAEEVQKDLAEGSAAGVSGTPGFFVNNQIISGAVPFAVFKEAIDAELAK
ncbi:DsbA family protein [Candidatus Woesearchaeota archaeon]|nr:DsbA family protein [Candidatus Woesearchaeota archaeon]